MSKVSSVQKYDYPSKDNFREENFFNDLLASCYEKNLLNENILSNIYLERIELLKEKLKYYTKDDSSSVMVEVAESILESIDYTIGIYLKTFDNVELIIDELKHNSLADILKKGHELINKKIIESKKLLNKINRNRLKIDNYSYNDTMDYGMILFFKKYDAFYASQETPGSIDYQLSIDNTNYVGVEYIYNYLERLNLENDFCNNFAISEINKLIKNYDKNCELLLINIFELLLINSLGVIICGRGLNNLNISSLERKYIANKLSNLSIEELEGELLKYAKICCEILYIEDKTLINYIEKATLKVTSLINGALEINKLEKVFISFNEDNANDIIRYTDGEKMANSEFRELSEEIRACSLMEDKIKLIKNNIKSLEDLIDMLSADCFFGDEYKIYFKSLSQMEIALLWKMKNEMSPGNEYDKDWYCELDKFVSSLSEEEKENIRKLDERIEF